MIADLAVLSDIGMGINGYARAEDGMVVDIGKGQDRHALPDLNITSDISLIADADDMLDRRSKAREELCKCRLRILDKDHRAGKALGSLWKKECARLCARARRIDMRRHGKGKIIRPRLVKGGEAAYHARAVAMDRAADKRRDRIDCLFHASCSFYWSFPITSSVMSKPPESTLGYLSELSITTSSFLFFTTSSMAVFSFCSS